MTVKSTHLQPGATWVFVHRGGKRTEYVYDRLMASNAGGFSALHALRNPETDKCAQVTEKWLREGDQGTDGYWEAIAEAPEMAEAA